MKKRYIIIILLILGYILLVIQIPKDSKQSRYHREEQERIDQRIDTNCSGPYCY